MSQTYMTKIAPGGLLQPGPSPGHLSKWQLHPYNSSGSTPGVILDSSLSLPLADPSINPGAFTPTVYPAQPHLTTLIETAFISHGSVVVATQLRSLSLPLSPFSQQPE